MTDLADRLIHLMLDTQVLKFGSFKTKSGRMSPYFFNFGSFDSGEVLGTLADLYAEHIASVHPEVENLFGPAYKGIPLAVMTSERLGRKLGRDVSFSFDRKEVKDHGEGGWLVGRTYQGGEKTVVVEDVITGGTSFRNTLPKLLAMDVDVLGGVVGVDRQEKGTGSAPASAEIRETYGVAISAITDVDSIVDRLDGREVCGRVWIDTKIKAAIEEYRQTYR